MHEIAALRLTESVVDIASCIIEKRITNAASLIVYADSNIESTNYYASALRSMYTVVWVNTNFSDWSSPIPNGRTVIVGEYAIDGRPHLIGFSLSSTSGPVKYDRPPADGFRRIVLKRSTNN